MYISNAVSLCFCGAGEADGDVFIRGNVPQAARFRPSCALNLSWRRYKSETPTQMRR